MMNYFVTEEELKEEIEKAVEAFLLTVSKHFAKQRVEIKEEIDREVDKLRLEMRTKKLVDIVKRKQKSAEGKD